MPDSHRQTRVSCRRSARGEGERLVSARRGHSVRPKRRRVVEQSGSWTHWCEQGDDHQPPRAGPYRAAGYTPNLESTAWHTVSVPGAAALAISDSRSRERGFRAGKLTPTSARAWPFLPLGGVLAPAGSASTHGLEAVRGPPSPLRRCSLSSVSGSVLAIRTPGAPRSALAAHLHDYRGRAADMCNPAWRS